MDEKEFLKRFADTLQERDLCIDTELIKKIDYFLQEHHKSYGEVYFYSKSKTAQQVIKEQVRIKLKDFLINQFEFLDYDWIDYDWMEKRVDEYVERNF